MLVQKDFMTKLSSLCVWVVPDSDVNTHLLTLTMRRVLFGCSTGIAWRLLWQGCSNIPMTNFTKEQWACWQAYRCRLQGRQVRLPVNPFQHQTPQGWRSRIWSQIALLGNRFRETIKFASKSLQVKWRKRLKQDKRKCADCSSKSIKLLTQCWCYRTVATVRDSTECCQRIVEIRVNCMVCRSNIAYRLRFQGFSVTWISLQAMF